MRVGPIDSWLGKFLQLFVSWDIDACIIHSLKISQLKEEDLLPKQIIVKGLRELKYYHNPNLHGEKYLYSTTLLYTLLNLENLDKEVKSLLHILIGRIKSKLNEKDALDHFIQAIGYNEDVLSLSALGFYSLNNTQDILSDKQYRIQLNRMYSQEGNYDNNENELIMELSIDQFTKIENLYPESVYHEFGKAMRAEESGLFDISDKLFQRGFRKLNTMTIIHEITKYLSPISSNQLYQLALYLKDVDKSRALKAIAIWEEISESPSESDITQQIYKLKGDILQEKDQTELAAEAFYTSGRNFYWTQNFQKALTLFEKAKENNPTNLPELSWYLSDTLLLVSSRTNGEFPSMDLLLRAEEIMSQIEPPSTRIWPYTAYCSTMLELIEFANIISRQFYCWQGLLIVERSYIKTDFSDLDNSQEYFRRFGVLLEVLYNLDLYSVAKYYLGKKEIELIESGQHFNSEFDYLKEHKIRQIVDRFSFDDLDHLIDKNKLDLFISYRSKDNKDNPDEIIKDISEINDYSMEESSSPDWSYTQKDPEIFDLYESDYWKSAALGINVYLDGDYTNGIKYLNLATQYFPLVYSNLWIYSNYSFALILNGQIEDGEKIIERIWQLFLSEKEQYSKFYMMRFIQTGIYYYHSKGGTESYDYITQVLEKWDDDRIVSTSDYSLYMGLLLFADKTKLATNLIIHCLENTDDHFTIKLFKVFWLPQLTRFYDNKISQVYFTRLHKAVSKAIISKQDKLMSYNKLKLNPQIVIDEIIEKYKKYNDTNDPKHLGRLSLSCLLLRFLCDSDSWNWKYLKYIEYINQHLTKVPEFQNEEVLFKKIVRLASDGLNRIQFNMVRNKLHRTYYYNRKKYYQLIIHYAISNNDYRKINSSIKQIFRESRLNFIESQSGVIQVGSLVGNVFKENILNINNFWALRSQITSNTDEYLSYDYENMLKTIDSYCYDYVNPSPEQSTLINPIRLYLNSRLIPNNQIDWKLLHDYLPELRNKIKENRGVTIPGIRIHEDTQSLFFDYSIFGFEKLLKQGTIEKDKLFTPNTKAELLYHGLEEQDLYEEKINSVVLGYWVDRDRIMVNTHLRYLSEIEFWSDHTKVIVRNLEFILNNMLNRFVSLEFTLNELDKLEDQLPVLSNNAKINIHYILKKLVKSRINISDLKTTFEEILTHLKTDEYQTRRVHTRKELNLFVLKIREKFSASLPGNQPDSLKFYLPADFEDIFHRYIHADYDNQQLLKEKIKFQINLMIQSTRRKNIGERICLVLSDDEIFFELQDFLDYKFPHIDIMLNKEIKEDEINEILDRINLQELEMNERNFLKSIVKVKETLTPQEILALLFGYLSSMDIPSDDVFDVFVEYLVSTTVKSIKGEYYEKVDLEKVIIKLKKIENIINLKNLILRMYLNSEEDKWIEFYGQMFDYFSNF